VVDGLSKQLDEYLQRNSALGNSVVPQQAKYAFSILSGILPYKGPSVKTVAAKRKRVRDLADSTHRRKVRSDVQVVVTKTPFLGTDVPGTRRSGRIQAMREAVIAISIPDL